MKVAAIAKRTGVNPKEGVSKYGSDAHFADPKNKKYPLNTAERARAAWSYINMPKNAAKYSSGDLATVKGRIRAACKRFGITTASQFLITSEYSVPLNGEPPAEVMYMPAGQATIHPSVNGEPRQISVTVTERTADVLQAELDQLLVGNVRPYIDFDHKGGAAAAIPKRFTWKEDQGVMLELDWTGAGKTAVGGRDYSYFSPTFILNESGDPAGLPKSGAIGALTNNPAFRDIKRISANQTGDGSAANNGDSTMTEAEEAALRTELETVRAELDELKKEDSQDELEVLRAENKALRDAAETQRVEAVNREAELLIQGAIDAGKLPPKNETVKAGLRKWFMSDPESVKAHIEAMVPNAAFKTVVTVTGAHKDVGRAPAVKDTSLLNLDTCRTCKAAVLEYQATHAGVTWEKALQICAARQPELFAGANS